MNEAIAPKNVNITINNGDVLSHLSSVLPISAPINKHANILNPIRATSPFAAAISRLSSSERPDLGAAEILATEFELSGVFGTRGADTVEVGVAAVASGVAEAVCVVGAGVAGVAGVASGVAGLAGAFMVGGLAAGKSLNISSSPS